MDMNAVLGQKYNGKPLPKTISLCALGRLPAFESEYRYIISFLSMLFTFMRR